MSGISAPGRQSQECTHIYLEAREQPDIFFLNRSLIDLELA